MERYCRLVGPIFLLLTTVTWAQEGSLPIVVAENAARVMLRSRPQVRRDTAIESVPRGTRLPLIDQNESWFQVELADGTKAWISRNYARADTLEDPCWIIDASAPLRQAPSASSESVSAVDRGELVSRKAREGDWAEIALPDGTSGWVPAAALETALAAERPEASETAGEEVGAGAGPESTAVGESVEETSGAGPTGESNPSEEQTGAVVNEPAGTSTEEKAVTAPAEPADSGTPDAPPATSAIPQAAPRQEVSLSFGGMFLLVVMLGGFAVLLTAGSFWWFRRRRIREIEQLIRVGQGVGGDVTGGEFLKNLKEAENRQAQLEQDLQQRFAALRQTIGAGESPAESDEGFAESRIEEIRKLLHEQQAKVNALSDLLALQNQKLAAAEEENRLLRQLLPRR